MISFPTLVLDYGHGGLDLRTGAYLTAGKRYTFPDGWTFLEGVYNREVAWRLFYLLHQHGFGAHTWDALTGNPWTRCPTCAADLVQENVSLSWRSGVAKVLAKTRPVLLLSLHGNAVGNTCEGPSQPAQGSCVFTWPGQSPADEVADSVAAALSRTLAGHTVGRLRVDTSDGDTDKEALFHVLNPAHIGRAEAVLGEVGFFTNRADAEFMASPEGQDTIARAIWAGLAPHLGV